MPDSGSGQPVFEEVEYFHRITYGREDNRKDFSRKGAARLSVELDGETLTLIQ